MKLLYISPISFPSRFANRVQVMKMSEAFSKETEFSLALDSFPNDPKPLWTSYHVTHPFKVSAIGRGLLRPRSFAFALRARRVIESADHDTVFYVRDVLAAFLLRILSRKFRARYVFELHTLTRFPKWVYRATLRDAKLIVTTNSAKREDLLKMGFSDERILVAPNGVDLPEIEALPEQEKAREALGWPLKGPILAYVGRVEESYGKSVLDALPGILGQECRVEVVTNKPREEAILALSAADILIAPYRGEREHMQKYMSPMKVREYMASGKPMIVSDLPAIRETVGSDEACFMKPGDVEGAARCVRALLLNKNQANEMAARAHAKAATLSWDGRARTIIARIATKVNL